MAETCEHCKTEVETVEPVVTGVGETEKWCAPCTEADATECDECNELADETEGVKTRRGPGREMDMCANCQDKAATKCKNCDDLFRTEDGQGEYCPTCADDMVICEHCAALVDSDDTSTVRIGEGRNDTETWCDGCRRADASRCERCDDYTSDDDSRRIGDDTWCSRCYSNYGAYCDECDEEYDSGQGGHDHESESEYIKDYHSTKFRPIMSDWVKEQPKPLYFGVELEVEAPAGSDRDAYAERVGQGLGQLLGGIEEDGSLSHGFEIITQPAGLDLHRQYWCEVDFTGLKSHDTSTCGLHIHFTRAAVSKLTLGKMLVFLNDPEHQIFLETFCRRAVNRYAKQAEGQKLTSGLKHGSERYQVLNTTNEKTVEFRLAKGTVKCTTILATLEFVYMLIRFCEATSGDKKKGLTVERFKMFIIQPAWAKETRFLRAYMADRGLATAREMNLPRLKPGEAAPAAVRENPARLPSYTAAALREYRETGE